MNENLRIIQPTLTTSRLVLEPIAEAHAAPLLQLVADKRLYRHQPHWLPDSLDELRERFALYSRGQSRDGHPQLNWAVRRRRDQAYVGLVQTTFLNLETKIGYTTFVPFWKMGYGKEAVGAMLDCLRDIYAVRKAMTSVDASNVASIALLEALGFERVSNGPAQYLEGRTDYRYERSL